MFWKQKGFSRLTKPEETEAQRGGMACARSHRETVPAVTVTRTAPSLAGELASSSAVEAGVQVRDPGEQSRAVFSCPLPAHNGIKSKLLSRREADLKKRKNPEHFKRMKNFVHQHFLFRPEFMNFNQINTGVLGTNTWTIMQNHYHDCSEN